MASTRTEMGPPRRPGDATRARRPGGIAGSVEDSTAAGVSQRNRPQDEITVRIPIQQSALQNKLPSRTAQGTSVRRPAIPTPSGRPSLTPQTHAPSLNNKANTTTGPSYYATARSGSSSSGRSQDAASNQTRNALRHKKSTMAHATPGSQADSARSDSSSSVPNSSSSSDPSSFQHLGCGITESPTEIRMAQTIEMPKTQGHSVTIYPELDRYRNIPAQPSGPFDSSVAEVPFKLATQDLPPPTPAFSGSSSQLSAGSPSTRFSESPGPGPYSRDSTPTSMSSQSPGLVAPMRFANHQNPRQLSPALTRPPVTRRRAGSASNEAEAFSVDPQGLAAVRESSTSSSSNSTVRDVERRGKEKVKEKEMAKKKKRLSPMPPSPPPRKSSQKFREDRIPSDSSPKRSGDTTRPIVPSPSPSKSASSRPNPTLPSRATPPMRPSRENTPDLQSQLFGQTAIIHSNLSSASLTSERRSSEDKAGAPSSLPRRATPSPLPDKYDPPARLVSDREATPAPRPGVPVAVKTDTNRKTRTPSPNTSTFNTRFPFFSRRAKTAPEIPQIDKKNKPTRKGPAAGTGHEGYGRLGSTRRRSGGASVGRANAGSGTSQESLDSLDSNQSVDPFLLDRMSPVVISGGEVVHNRNKTSDLSRSETNQRFPLSHPSMEPRGDSDAPAASSISRTAAWASGLPRGGRPSATNRRPSDSSDSEAVAMKSTLASRRSAQRLRSSPDQAPLRLPKPINTSGGTSPSITSIDTSVVSDDSHLEIERKTSRGHKVHGMTPPKKLTKRARSPRKWNLFSRSQRQQSKKEEQPELVSATVKVVPHKPVAFYAMMDGSEQEQDFAPPNVEDILRDANVLEMPFDVPTPPPINSRERLPSRDHAEQPYNSQVTTETANLQEAPQIRRMDKSIARYPGMVAKPTSWETTTKTSSGRPSRLPQVGRIPKVVNNRTEPPSQKSFSRPFHRGSYQKGLQASAVYDDSVAKGPSPPKPTTPELTPEASTATSAETIHPQPEEFFVFSPNRNYQGHSSSDSSSLGVFAFAQAMAGVPDPSAPLVEDEIWDEYNDLLGEVPLSATSSKGIPFHLEAYEKTLPEKSQVLESPTLAPPSAKSFNTTTDGGRVATESTTYSADMTARIQAAFAPKPEQDAHDSELNPGDRDQQSVTDAGRKRSAASHQRNSNASRTSRKTSSSSSSKSSEDDSPMSQVNLRVGSMTVSKWLSFGHVLFSPVRDELLPDQGSLKRQSILVIDGLGNDDWSFYAAETYPSVTFFNLSPRAPLPSEQPTSSSFPLSPPNHHQIQYTSHAGKFPFGPESFTSVVYRFPAAAPESHYRNIISEARRVLKPGGYIELSILDVDLNNMGNRGRRTVRRLKERIHEKAPCVSLGSTSDFVVRLLGKKGFSDMKACHVGVPVANIISPTNRAAKRSSIDVSKRVKDQRSLADMMNDNSDMADENITKMVAKVGRWWYTRCYESAAGTSAASKSIWADRAFLAECEELRTSLKLMVCHARVPERGRISSI